MGALQVRRVQEGWSLDVLLPGVQVSKKTQRRERHIAVDILLIVGSGLLSEALHSHSLSSIVGGLAVVGLALWLDRRGVIADETENQ